MLNRIVELALRYRLLSLVALGALVVLGIRAYRQVPIDAFPDVTPAQVSVVTESPGLAPEDVEQLLTFPIESSLAGLPGVQTVRSISMFGLSTVTVYLDDATNIYFARQLIAERLQQAKARLPEGYGEPELGPNVSGLGEVFRYTVESTDHKLSNLALRTLQDWTIRVQLLTVPGVDEVVSWGEQKQYQVLVDPRKLIKYGLSFKNVTEALLANNRQVGGQYIDLGHEQYLVRGTGLVSGTADIGAIPLAAAGDTPIYVRDVAEVREGGGRRFGAVTKDGADVVFGIVVQRIGENAKQVTTAIKEKLTAVRQLLPPGVAINTVYDRTRLVDRAVATATSTLAEGALLVIIVLFLFLGEIRSALVVVLALPLAMLVAFILMQQFGLSANLMSLAGLAVGIGMMIDGAVVLVENAYRLLGRARVGESRIQAIRQAAAEVSKPVAFAILIIIVVFLPLFSLTDIEGKLFKPMALSITFAMLGSLALTLTVIPVLASLILKPTKDRETSLVNRAKRLYLPLLDASLRRKRRTVTAAILLLVTALTLVPFLGREFVPPLQEGSFLFLIGTIPSSSLAEGVAVSQTAERVMHTFPQVRTAVATIGRAERGEPEDVNRIEMLVDLNERKTWPEAISYQALADEMRQKLEHALPTAVATGSQPIKMRVDELISGVKAPLSLRIYGEDLGELDRLAARIKAVLDRVQGVADLALEANRGKPQIAVRVDRLAAARYGISVDDVLDVVQTGIGGKPAGVVFDGTRRFDIEVWLKPEFRGSVETIADLPLRTRDGALLPLSRVATVKTSEGYAFIRHDSLQRNVVIQMDVHGRDVDGFVRDARAAIARQVTLPPGYRLEWGGAFKNQQRAMAKLAVIVPLTIGLIFLLLYTAFDSVVLAGLIIANVPFALIGGIFALFVSGQYLSVPAAIGFIAVFGVAMLNGIVLVSFINEQLQLGKNLREAVRDGALLRLRPVLMTASVTVLGLLPMLLSQGVGAETQRPLATVVIGGLISSTLLTLLLLPLMYEWAFLHGHKYDAGATNA
jgi:heavy metal efflux system protein